MAFDAFLYITSRYVDGYPSNWTVLNPEPVVVGSAKGKRTYRSGQNELDSDNMIQISRNPRPNSLRGTRPDTRWARSPTLDCE